MPFEWDEAKNLSNIKKHGLDFRDCQCLFTGATPFLVTVDQDEDYGEERWKGIGQIEGAVVVVVVFAERENDTIRNIPMRKANSRERACYEEEIKNRLGEG